jgi:putative aminopeptidase FrvX
VIDRDRRVNEFLELARTSSVSRREGEVARRLVATLKHMGAQEDVDDAGHHVGDDTGARRQRAAYPPRRQRSGTRIANRGGGMRDSHTVNEWIDVKDMVATAQLLAETLRRHT